MTTEEKIQILRDATDRAYETVDKAGGPDMLQLGFKSLLESISYMNWIIHELSHTPQAETPDTPVPEPEKPIEPVETVEPEKPKDAEPAKSISVGAVRGALAAAHTNGVNVTEVIQSFGAKSFSDLTPDQYPAVMAMLEGR